jgi:hypothetical protein
MPAWNASRQEGLRSGLPRTALKPVIQRPLGSPLAEMLLTGAIRDGEPVPASVLDGPPAVRGATPAQAN